MASACEPFSLDTQYDLNIMIDSEKSGCNIRWPLVVGIVIILFSITSYFYVRVFMLSDNMNDKYKLICIGNSNKMLINNIGLRPYSFIDFLEADVVADQCRASDDGLGLPPEAMVLAHVANFEVFRVSHL